MHVSVQPTPLSPWRQLAEYEESRSGGGNHGHGFGATAVFVGTMRDFNEGDAVDRMWLEHYPGMTEQHLETIVAKVSEAHGLLDALVIHRVGEIAPGDAIVLVAVWSAHRASAFRASREIMEDLKSQAPFWKRETLTPVDGEDNRVRQSSTRWVERNTRG